MTGNSKKTKKKGFTLIETLIAIVVLMMAITGPLTIAEKGLQSTTIAKDQDIAFYLAQDAVEYVRWVRDTNKLKGNAFLQGLNGVNNTFTTSDYLNGDCTSATGSAACTVDSIQNSIYSCPSGVCPVLNFDSNNDYFTYNSGSNIAASPFTRTVSILQCNYGGATCGATQNPGEAVVTVKISWNDPRTQVISVNEILYDWQ